MSSFVDWQAIGMIWRRELIRFQRDRTQIAGSIARPVLWLVVMGMGMGSAMQGFGGHSRYTEYLFPGIVAMNLVYASFLSAISVIWDREFGFLKEILVAPIGRSSIALGKSASGATVACLQGILVLCFLPLVGLSISGWRLLISIPLMLAIAFPLTAAGLFIASRMTSFEGFGTLANFVVMPMFFLSGAVFPMETAPRFFRIVSRFNPLTYGVDLLRGVFYGTHHHPYWFSLSCLALFGGLALTGAVASFRHRS